MTEEKDGRTHILDLLEDMAKEIATCPNKEESEEGECGQWDCYNCKELGNHFKFVSETAATLCAILQNLLLSNPDIELGDMREDPNDLELLAKNCAKEIPDSLYQ